MTKSTITMADARRWLELFTEQILAQKEHLTELDSAIGDADHGINMSRGMTAVMAKLDGTEPTSLGELFKGAGMTLVTTVGGASGPLYGTWFLRLGGVGVGDELDSVGLGEALRAALEGIVARGKAEAGDKTMFDALAPAVGAYDAAVAVGANAATAARAAADAADIGRDATIPMLARKGRASYLGERSVGHLDPGAASSALLIRALADALAETDTGDPAPAASAGGTTP